MHVQLQTADCQSVAELHRALEQTLHLPSYYGGNLDALWDCLTGSIELPLTIEWVDYQQTQAHLGEYAQRVFELFQEAETVLEGFELIIGEDC